MSNPTPQLEELKEPAPVYNRNSINYLKVPNPVQNEAPNQLCDNADDSGQSDNSRGTRSKRAVGRPKQDPDRYVEDSKRKIAQWRAKLYEKGANHPKEVKQKLRNQISAQMSRMKKHEENQELIERHQNTVT